MGEMQDRFEVRAEHFARGQRELKEYLQDFERRAANQPFLAAGEAWGNTHGPINYLRKRSVDLFGLDVEEYGPIILSSALAPAEEEPESWGSITPLCGSVGACTFAVFCNALR